MSQVFNCGGEKSFYLWGALCSNPKDNDHSLPLGNYVDIFFPPCKRSRISAPFVFSGGTSEHKRSSIEVLPDECLFEIFRRLPGGEAKSACACVSKRWLMLVSSIRPGETCVQKIVEPSKREVEPVSSVTAKSLGSNGNVKAALTDGTKSESEDGAVDILGDGYLDRCLEEQNATDIRLAAIAVGTQSRGGLGKLSVRGSNSIRGVTDSGLKAIASGCPSLRTLSLWNVSFIGDEGLVEIAKGCRLLENLDLCHCPGISDKALQAIADHCPNFTSLTVESCLNIENEGLRAIARCCVNLKSVSVKNCPRVGDQGIASIFTSAGNSISKVRLEALNINDVSLAVIGRYGSSLTELVLSGLQEVYERGFWVMGKCQGLAKLHSFSVTSCKGMTDAALQAVLEGSPYLRRVSFRKCPVSDKGLVSFVKGAESLESIQLDECHSFTHYGFFGILAYCGRKLKSISIATCLGIKNVVFGLPSLLPCHSLRSLSVRNCPGFGNNIMLALASLCPNVMHIELVSLNGINDEGILPLVQSSDAGLVKVRLSGCNNVTDNVISEIAKLHGGMLELLEIDGCGGITDASLFAIAEYCSVLSELDISSCRITNAGIAALANDAVQVSLHILSLSGCPLISDRSVPFLVKFDDLAGLNVQYCRGISRRGVELLMDHPWPCDVAY